MTIRLFVFAGCAILAWRPLHAAPADYFAVEVSDAETHRGLPLVELETIDHQRFVTDNGGWIAMAEPQLEGSRVFFQVNSPGYASPQTAEGFPGAVLEVRAGSAARLELKRTQIAERLYRFTGTGLYRDSLLLGKPAPVTEPLQNGGVAGQDSLSAALFRGRLHWFAGDTLRLRHPLGQYFTAGATSELPAGGGLEPGEGLDLHYAVDPDGFTRAMWPAPKDRQGAIWTDGVLTLRDADGQEQMLAHFAHMQSAGEMISHGLGLFDPEANGFRPCQTLPPEETWRYPAGQPTRGRGLDDGYYLFSAPALELAPFLAVRAKAALTELLRPGSYVAFTCLEPETNAVERDVAGNVVYGWKSGLLPLSPKNERALIAAGALNAEEALYQPRDAESGQVLEFRAGSVHWNEYRKCWVMIAEQLGESGYTGEIYYAEAASAVGPWRAARKVATHGAQSFFNPVHFPFFDGEGGRYLYFAGTYAATAASVLPTPRYDDNQIMYRLDLADERLHLLP